METARGHGEETGQGEREPTLIRCLCLEQEWAAGSRDTPLLKQKEMEAQGL